MQLFLYVLSAVLISMPAIAQDFPFEESTWEVNAQGSVFEYYKGEQSLYLKNGGAVLPDVEFQDGVIEFDVALHESRGFPGIAWRVQEGLNYEDLYFRPHLSGMPDAIQYTPVFHGNSGWQLYHDLSTGVNDGLMSWRYLNGHQYNGMYTFRFDVWMHVKLVVRGGEAWLYLDHGKEPVLHMSSLRHDTRSGGIAVHTSFGGAHFANLKLSSFDHQVDSKSAGADGPGQPPAGQIMYWELSQTHPDDAVAELHVIDELCSVSIWETVNTEEDGLLNISRYRERQQSDTMAKNTVLVKYVIVSTIETEAIQEIVFGYSDRVQVYCNGRIVYAGNNAYHSRDYRYLGTIGYFDSVYLPLRSGRNEIVFAVTESFGGWGLQARLVD